MPAVIHPGEVKVVGGTLGGGLVIGQTRCDEWGNIYFRQVQGSRFLLSPIAEISADGSRSHVFDFNALSGKDMTSLQVNDFTVRGSTLFMVGSSADGKVHVIEYSSDGQVKNVVTLTDSSPSGNAPAGVLTPSKLGIMPGGEFLIFGIRATRQDTTGDSHPNYTYTPSIELYDLSGRFMTSAQLKADDINLNDKKHTLTENFRAVDLALTANAPDGVYIVAYSKTPRVYVVSPAGEVSLKASLESSGEDFRPLSISANGTELLMQFVKSQGENSEYKFVVYNSASGEILRAYRPADEFSGIFTCYDWRNQFKFISTNAQGQRVLKFGFAR